MQTFSLFRQNSSPISQYKARGFTLIELLVSAAVITIVSGIVLVRFNTFDSTVLLKSLAYEVATTIREAQVYSVSVFNIVGGSQQTFRYPFGVSFTQGNTNYVLFRYQNASPGARPYNDIAEADPDVAAIVTSYTLGGSTEIYRVCVKLTGVASESCQTSSGRLDISFRRPEFYAIFNASWLAANQQDSIEYAKVEFRSTRNPSKRWIVEVKLLGQISVYRCTSTMDPTCV